MATGWARSRAHRTSIQPLTLTATKLRIFCLCAVIFANHQPDPPPTLRRFTTMAKSCIFILALVTLVATAAAQACKPSECAHKLLLFRVTTARAITSAGHNEAAKPPMALYWLLMCFQRCPLRTYRTFVMPCPALPLSTTQLLQTQP